MTKEPPTREATGGATEKESHGCVKRRATESSE